MSIFAHLEGVPGSNTESQETREQYGLCSDVDSKLLQVDGLIEIITWDVHVAVFVVRDK